MKKHNEQLDGKKIKLIGLVSFLMGMVQAILVYVMSSYFSESFHTENVGIFYVIGYVIVLICLINLHKLIKKFGKTEVFFITFVARLVILGFLAIISPSLIGALLLVAYIVFGNVNWVVLDVILESFSTDKMAGRIRGFQATVLSAGFLLGPIISTQILENFNFQYVFLIALVIDVFIVLVAAKSLRRVNHTLKGSLLVKNVISKIIHRPNILRIYYISFILDFFYAVMVIYMPIYLRNLGISWENIGIIFTVMLVPFVIFPYPAGYLADKKWGEKKMLVTAVFIMAVSTFLVFYINSKSVIIWGVALFFTRVGASLIQILRDSYFYKRVDGDDVDLVNFYRTSMSVAYIVAPAVSAIVLLFFPIKTMFFVLALVVLSGLYPAFRLVNNKCEADIDKININGKCG